MNPIISPTEQAAEVAAALAHELQRGLTDADAESYEGSFADDILWGSPYGGTVEGRAVLLGIHRRLMAAGTAPPSRFEVVAVRAPAPSTVVAQIRRQSLDPDGFSEVALYVLVERAGRWLVVAGQNTPVGTPPTQ